MITHEPLHLASCDFAYIDNFYNPIEFQGHRSTVKVTWVFGVFCVHDTAATRGQYLALSKAWRSCFFI